MSAIDLQLLDLLKLGRETLAVVARGVAAGDCTYRCQLLASQFYEALLSALNETRAFDRRHSFLAAAVERCERAAKPGLAPEVILSELRIALALLDRAGPLPAEEQRVVRMPPQLRVIQGGLSLSS